MRIPIFSANSNPSVDPPILRKSLSYVEEMIARGQAFWLDQQKPKMGVLCFRNSLRPSRNAYDASVQVVAGSGFDSAWAIRQSGWAGPQVWQLKANA